MTRRQRLSHGPPAAWQGIRRMRDASKLAAQVLRHAGSLVQVRSARQERSLKF